MVLQRQVAGRGVSGHLRDETYEYIVEPVPWGDEFLTVHWGFRVALDQQQLVLADPERDCPPQWFCKLTSPACPCHRALFDKC